ncbi:hypothetical protein H6P81_014311 [Aristolochia fimbriata]|uniref:Transmembrane protein n=1 Tax=Aristolochia fimbriata TaxID=158543 RepID=A0AAV7EHE3_ARIFI|nr:hypothetical protein H6P81_014311 [Aristolochia fimbriata]
MQQSPSFSFSLRFAAFIIVLLALPLLFLGGTASAARTNPAADSAAAVAALSESEAANYPVKPVIATVVSVFSRGRVPPSGPSHRGHAAPVFTRHRLLRTNLGSNGPNFRELSSTPSPGVGH